MKLIRILPRPFFKSKKSSSRRSINAGTGDPLSFNSNTTSSSSSSTSDVVFKNQIGLSTPTSVLPSDWSPSDDVTTTTTTNGVYFELKQAFDMIDSDGDGKIRKEEMESLLCRLGLEPPSREEMQQMLDDVDVDGDGCITLDEFCAIGSAFAPPACDTELRDTFDFFDSDRDGKITAEELYSVFRTMIGDERCTLEDCRRMIKGVDKNRDGFVCFEDFSLMMDLQLT